MAALSKFRKVELARHLFLFYRNLVHRNLLAFTAQQCRKRSPISIVLQGRKKLGAFKNFVSHLLTHGTDEDLTNFTGLKFNELFTLYNGIKEQIAPKPRARKDSLSAKEMLIMTLSFLRGGLSMHYATTQWLVSRWTLPRVIKKVGQAICQYVASQHNFMPETATEWKRVAEGFEKRWQLPHCIGCVDGMHIRVRKFPNMGSMNWNYKKFNSVILLAVVDYKYRILHFNVGAPGIRSDGGVFNEDRLGEMVRNNSLDLPQPEPLPKDPTGKKFGYFLAADAGFSIGENILHPFSGEDLSDDKVYFNYRLSRARICVECVFGHLASRFGVLKQVTGHQDTATLIVRTCCYLHNFLRATREDDEEELCVIGRRRRRLFEGEEDDEVQEKMSGIELRDSLKDYFYHKDNIGRVI